MVELEQQSNDDFKHVPEQDGGWRRWQWNLKTLLLLMAAIATWTAYVRTTRLNQRLRDEVGTLRELAGELVVTDAEQFAIVDSPDQWYGENRWDVYLPPGSDYAMNLATRRVDENGVPEAAEKVLLEHGHHQVRLEQEQRGDHWEISVELDGRVAITAREASDWAGDRGSTGMVDYGGTEQFPTDEPLILERSRFLHAAPPPSSPRASTEPDEPSNGLILWIEKDGRLSRP
jgi:hypothetical protein